MDILTVFFASLEESKRKERILKEEGALEEETDGWFFSRQGKNLKVTYVKHRE